MLLLRLLLHALAIVSLLGLVFYSFENGYKNDFTFDDHLAIEGNGDVDVNNQPFRHLWFSDIWGKDLLAHDSHRSYRPLLIVIFRYLYTQSREAPLFRIVSICAHGITTLLIYFWAKHLLHYDIADTFGRMIVAWSTAACFAAHPIHVEAVTAVVNLAEPLSAFCILLGYICFQYNFNSQVYDVTAKVAIENSQNKNFPLIATALCTIIWWIISTIAVLCKETGILGALLPLVYLLGRWTVVFIGRFLRLFTKRSARLIEVRPNFISSIWWFANTSFYLYLYFAMRSLLVNPQREQFFSSPVNLIQFIWEFPWKHQGDSYLNASQLLRRAENPFAFITDTKTKLYSMLYLYFRYFYVLLWPQEQSPEYSYNCIPAVSDTHDLRLKISLITSLSIFLLGIYSCYLLTRPINIQQEVEVKEDTKKEEENTENQELQQPVSNYVVQSALFEGMLWLIIPFLPLTGIVFTLGTLLAERLLYASSIGFCFLLAYLLFAIVVQWAGKLCLGKKADSFIIRITLYSVYMGIMSTMIYQYTIWTRQYNLVWQNDAHLFLHAVRVCPQSGKSHLQVSKLFSNQGYMYEAQYHIEQAKQIDPEFCDVHLQDAYILLGKNISNPEEYDAESSLKRVLAAYKSSTSHSSATSSSAHILDISAPDIMSRIAKAIRALRRSIGCVYTNSQALRLLSQLWELQLLAAQQSPMAMPSVSSQVHHPQWFRMQLLRKQAHQAHEIHMDVMAITKYIESANILYEIATQKTTSSTSQSNSKSKSKSKKASSTSSTSTTAPSGALEQQKALHILSKAQKIVHPYFHYPKSADVATSSYSDEFIRQLLDYDDAQWQLITGLRCRIATLSGGMRSTWMESMRISWHSAIDHTSLRNKTANRTTPLPQEAAWYAGIFRILHDLSTGATDTHCFVHAMHHNSPSAESWEQLKIANMHIMKWFQELPSSILFRYLPVLVHETNNQEQDSTLKKSHLTVYRSDFMHVLERNRTYSEVFPQKHSLKANYPTIEDSFLPVVTIYARNILVFALSQEPTSLLYPLYQKFVQTMRNGGDLSRFQYTNDVSVQTNQQLQSLSSQLLTLLQQESGIKRQLSRLYTFATHRYYVHKKYSMAAHYGGYAIFQELSHAISFKLAASSATEAVVDARTSASTAQLLELLHNYRARTLRLWHMTHLFDSVQVQTQRLHMQSLYTSPASHSSMSSSWSFLFDAADFIAPNRSAPLSSSSTKHSRNTGNHLLSMHFKEVWQQLFPLRELIDMLHQANITQLLTSSASKATTKKAVDNSILYGRTINVHVSEVKRLLDDPVFCTNLYWYTDALAGVSGFYDEAVYAEGIAQLLSLYRFCALRHPTAIEQFMDAPADEKRQQPEEQEEALGKKKSKKKETKEKSKKGKEKNKNASSMQFTPFFSATNQTNMMTFLSTIEDMVAKQLSPLIQDSYAPSTATFQQNANGKETDETMADLNQRTERMTRMARILPLSVVDELIQKFQRIACQLHGKDDCFPPQDSA